MRKLILSMLTILILAGCAKDVEVGPVAVPEKMEGTKSALPDNLTSIDTVHVKYQVGKEVKEANLDFAPKGIIRGKLSPLVPAEDTKSLLKVLGIESKVSASGNNGQMEYNGNLLSFKKGDNYLFLNNDNGIDMGEPVQYQNGTLYVPIFPILDSLKISYEVNQNIVIIGGKYTDDEASNN